jgi:hypothetical protein
MKRLSQADFSRNYSASGMLSAEEIVSPSKRRGIPAG